MMDKGWYWLVALGVIATFIGFLYMFRLAYAVFLGPRKAGHEAVREAPAQLLLPQFVLVAAILVLSFFPKLVMDPVSAAIDPYFASTLVWEGMSLEMIYGYWNPVPVMVSTVAIAAVLFLMVWLVYKSRHSRPTPSGVARFYAFYRSALNASVVPSRQRFLGWGVRPDDRCGWIDAKDLHRRRPDLRTPYSSLCRRLVFDQHVERAADGEEEKHLVAAV